MLYRDIKCNISVKALCRINYVQVNPKFAYGASWHYVNKLNKSLTVEV